MTCCLLLDVKFKFPPWSPSPPSPVPLTRVRQTQALCLCHREQDIVFHQRAFVLTNLIWNWGHSSLSSVLLLREHIFPLREQANDSVHRSFYPNSRGPPRVFCTVSVAGFDLKSFISKEHEFIRAHCKKNKKTKQNSKSNRVGKFALKWIHYKIEGSDVTCDLVWHPLMNWGVPVIHPEASKCCTGPLWPGANEKSMRLWHINLSSHFITGTRCQKESRRRVWPCWPAQKQAL